MQKNLKKYYPFFLEELLLQYWYLIDDKNNKCVISFRTASLK